MTTKSNFIHLALSPLRSATNDHRLTTNDKAFFRSTPSSLRLATNDNRMTTNDNFFHAALSPMRSATNDKHNHKLNSIFYQTSTIIHFALLFAILLFSTSFSQTIIKEKVEVKPGQINLLQPTSAVSSIIPGGVVIPYNAKLSVWYSSSEAIDYPVSTATELRMYFTTGDSLDSDATLTRFADYYEYPDNILNICTYDFENHFHYYYLNSPQPYQGGRIAQGDTILFAWYADSPWGYYEYPINTITEIIVNGKLVGWDISFGSYDYCLQGWETKLDISVGLEEAIELDVQINPATVALSDTAVITIRKKNTDGTIVDFPASQTFEIGMLEGCAAGKLHKAEVDSNYFYNITQPINFIAADTLEGEDNDTVKVRVGLIEIGSSANSIGLRKKLLEKIKVAENKIPEKIKSKKKETREVKTQNNTAINKKALTPFNTENYFCFYPGVFVTQDVIAEKSFETGCDYESCGGSYDTLNIKIELLTQPNNFRAAKYIFTNKDSTGKYKSCVIDEDTTTVCKVDSANIANGVVAQSTPVRYLSRLRFNSLSNKWEKSWILKTCENDSGKIEYRTITTDSVLTPIYLDFVADVCYDLISQNTLNQTLVSDTAALRDTSIVSNANIAFTDLCGHKCYPQIISQNGYIFEEVIYLHELQHRNHYKRILDSLKQEYLINKIKKDFTYDCEIFQKFIKNAESDSSSFESKIIQFVREATITYCFESGIEYREDNRVIVKANKVRELANEKKRHYVKPIEKLIDYYHKALANARSTPYPVTTCMICPP